MSASPPSGSRLEARENDNEEEIIHPWRDEQIRWPDEEDENRRQQQQQQEQQEEGKDEEKDDDDNERGFDPFKDPDPTKTFTYEFLSRDKKPLKIELKGYKYESDQIWKSTGLTLWKASEHLCNYISKHDDLLQNRAILELGAGLGLVGILAHILTCDSDSTVCITDGDSDALTYLKQNVWQTCLNNSSTTSTVSCRQLIWGRETSAAFRNSHGTFDVILASDIIYALCIIEPLWTTVQTLLALDGIFIMAFARRRVPVSIDFVLESSIQAGFKYEGGEAKEAPGIFIYTFSRN